MQLRATGGEVGASSALAPKIGPLGLVSLLLVTPDVAQVLTILSGDAQSPKKVGEGEQQSALV